jgi:hypothetical protein
MFCCFVENLAYTRPNKWERMGSLSVVCVPLFTEYSYGSKISAERSAGIIDDAVDLNLVRRDW